MFTSTARMFIRSVLIIAALLIGAPLGSEAVGRVPDAMSIPASLAHVLPAVVMIVTRDSAGRHLEDGTGFAIDPSGILLTNSHVVRSAASIEVIFYDRRSVPGEVIGVAPELDLALVKIFVPMPIPTIPFGNSDALSLGTPVYVIGNPFGLGTSVSAGIVSAFNRSMKLDRSTNLKRSVELDRERQDGIYDDMIQTDAVVNPGNSGGPLMNLEGQVVGVTSDLFTVQDGGSIGIGFAIPSNDARFIANKLMDPDDRRLGWIGALMQDLTPDMASAVGRPDVEGAIVSALTPGGPASRAGLREGDVILDINGHELADGRAAARYCAISPIGQPVTLAIWRDGHMLELNVVVAGKPLSAMPSEPMTAATGGPRSGNSA